MREDRDKESDAHLNDIWRVKLANRRDVLLQRLLVLLTQS